MRNPHATTSVKKSPMLWSAIDSAHAITDGKSA